MCHFSAFHAEGCCRFYPPNSGSSSTARLWSLRLAADFQVFSSDRHASFTPSTLLFQPSLPLPRSCCRHLLPVVGFTLPEHQARNRCRMEADFQVFSPAAIHTPTQYRRKRNASCNMSALLPSLHSLFPPLYFIYCSLLPLLFVPRERYKKYLSPAQANFLIRHLCLEPPDE